MGAVQDEPSAVLGDHADVDPPLAVDQFGSTDVVDVLATYLTVV